MIQHATHAEDSYRIDPGLWTRGRNGIAFVALISWIAAIAGYFLEPARFFQSYLVGFLFSIFIPLGALFFLMVMFLTGSAWSVTMRRIVENMVVTLPLGLLLCIPVLMGMGTLYEWAHPGAADHDSLLRAKQAYLNPSGFTWRMVIYFLLWSLWATRIYKHSTRQDKTKSLDQMHAISRWCAPGLLMLVLSGTLASFDWSMSLDPHWYSTIFGLYCFAGGAFAFMALWLLILVSLREKGVLRNTVNLEHYHDHRQMDVRVDDFLGVYRFLAVPVDLVREYPGRDHLVPASIPGIVGMGERAAAVRPLHLPVLGPGAAVEQAEPENADVDGDLVPGDPVHRLLLAGDAELLPCTVLLRTGWTSRACWRR